MHTKSTPWYFFKIMFTEWHLLPDLLKILGMTSSKSKKICKSSMKIVSKCKRVNHKRKIIRKMLIRNRQQYCVHEVDGTVYLGLQFIAHRLS